MTRRQELRAAARSGGVTAPAARKTRREQLREQTATARERRRPQQRNAGALGPAAAVATRRAQSAGPAIVSQSGLSLGRQLSRRVNEGAISQEQGERTARERNELERVYGPDWRQKVFGEDVQRLRVGLAGAQKGNPQYQAAAQQIKEARKKALEKARKRLYITKTSPGFNEGAGTTGTGTAY